MKKIICLPILIFIFNTANSQYSIGLNPSYMTDNNYSEIWGISIAAKRFVKNNLEVGISGTYYFNPLNFPNYTDGLYYYTYSNPDAICYTTHKILPITGFTNIYLSKKRRRVQTSLQLHIGATFVDTYTKQDNITTSTVITNKKKQAFLNAGFGTNFTIPLSKKLSFNINGMYSYVFGNTENRFNTPANWRVNYINDNVRFYFNFSAGCYYNLKAKGKQNKK